MYPAFLLLQGGFNRIAEPLATSGRADIELVQLAGNGAVAHSLPFQAAHDVEDLRRGPASDGEPSIKRNAGGTSGTGRAWAVLVTHSTARARPEGCADAPQGQIRDISVDRRPGVSKRRVHRL